MGDNTKFVDLPLADKAAIEMQYGARGDVLANKIKYVRELTTAEAGTFSKKDVAHPAASVLQTLYKLTGKLLPLKFNVAVDRAFDTEDALRTNYVLVEDRFLAVVMNKRNTPLEIGYHNLKSLDKDEVDAELRKSMEAEIRLGFDLLRGQLARFSVYNTAEDEYAIIITAVEALSQNFDFKKIFRAALNIPEPPDISSIMANIRVGAGAMSGPIKDYWSKLLVDMPAPAKVPHGKGNFSRKKYSEENYLTHVPRDILSDLKIKAESNKIMLMSILQTAWGFLLQQCNKQTNISFCVLVPQKKKQDGNPGAQSLVPVRLQVDGNPTVKDLIIKAFKQFVISQPYATLGREDIMNLMGQQAEDFDHYLNFYDFFAESKSYADIIGASDGKVVTQKYWDVRDALMEVSFRNDDNQVVLSVHYNSEVYPQQDVVVLMKHYLLVLQKMLTDWNEPYEKFMERLGKHWEAVLDQLVNQKEDPRSIIQDALSRIGLFQECEQGIIQLFMRDAKLYTKFEGDRISEQDVENQVVFVLQGKVARSIETGDGWYNTLDILKENSWINECVLLPKRKVRVSAEVITEQATILVVPYVTLLETLKKSPLLAQNIIIHTMRQLEKYQRLWIQS